MTLLALLGVAGVGGALAAVGGRGGARLVRLAALAGLVALAAALLLAAMLPDVGVTEEGRTTTQDVGLFDGRLVAGAYARAALALWAGASIVVVALTWLLDGPNGARRLVAATAASLVAGIVALCATDPALAAVAAAGTGLAGLLVVLGPGREASIPAAVRELRAGLGAPTAALIGIAAAPVAGAVVVAEAARGGSGGSGAAPVLGLAAVVIVLAVAVRYGAIPAHLRVARLTDAAPSTALPLLLAWSPLPLAVAGFAAVELLIAPIDVPLDGERAIVLTIAVLTLGGAAFAAFVQDDLRHATAYLVIADGGLALVGLAAFAPDAWAPGRTWLLVLAASKTALAMWAAAAEARFETWTIPDLRGWMRRAPLLGIALALTVGATFGLPGWAAFEARSDLARIAVASPWDALLALLALATLPAYLRLFAVGMGPASTRVAAAAPERLDWGPRRTRLVAAGDPPGPGTAPPPSGDAGGTATEGASETASETATEAGGAAEDDPGEAPTGLGDGAAEPDSTPADATTAAVSRPRMASAAARAAVVAGLVATRAGASLRSLPGSLRGLPVSVRRNRAPTVSLLVLVLAVLAAMVSAGTVDVAGPAAAPAPVVGVTPSD